MMDYNPKYALYRIDTNLGLAENDFNKIFKVYPMDENAETIVNEGIVSGITKGAKFIGNAIISAITTLWHKLVKFVQGIVAKIKKFFKGDTDKAPNHPNMEVRFISEANLIKGNFHNTKDIVDAGMKAIESITNKINQISQQQISITQECNRRIEAAKNQLNQQQSPVFSIDEISILKSLFLIIFYLSISSKLRIKFISLRVSDNEINISSIHPLCKTVRNSLWKTLAMRSPRKNNFWTSRLLIFLNSEEVGKSLQRMNSSCFHCEYRTSAIFYELIYNSFCIIKISVAETCKRTDSDDIAIAAIVYVLFDELYLKEINKSKE
jgi:hypothetical protein